MQVTTGKRSRPQRVVIYGTEGIGKTTLAAAFPDPIFIDVDRGSDHLDVSRTEPDTWAGITATITDIISTPGQYKTIVLDAADAAERMAIAHVCDKHKKADIEAFGYGKGYTLLADVWNDLLKLLNTAIDAGYNVVIIAHAHIRKFEKPDESQGFDRYTLKLTDAGKTSLSAQTKEWCDALLFCNYKTIVVAADNEKPKGKGGTRTIYTAHHPAYDAKNRHDLPDELPMAIGSLMPIVAGITSATVTTEKKKETPAEAPKSTPKATPKAAADVVPDAGAYPAALWQQMETKGITKKEMDQYLTDKLKITVPIVSVPQKLVDRMATDENFAKIDNYIKTNYRGDAT